MKTPLKTDMFGGIKDASGYTVATLDVHHPEYSEYRELFKYSPELKTALEEIAALVSDDYLTHEEIMEKVALRARRALAIIIPNRPGPWTAAPETYAKLSNS